MRRFFPACVNKGTEKKHTKQEKKGKRKKSAKLSVCVLECVCVCGLWAAHVLSLLTLLWVGTTRGPLVLAIQSVLACVCDRFMSCSCLVSTYTLTSGDNAWSACACHTERVSTCVYTLWVAHVLSLLTLSWVGTTRGLLVLYTCTFNTHISEAFFSPLA